MRLTLRRRLAILPVSFEKGCHCCLFLLNRTTRSLCPFEQRLRSSKWSRLCQRYDIQTPSVVAEVRASPNHNERSNGMMPDMIILHYTGARDIEAAIRYLCTPGSEASSHYVVLQDGHIIQLVPELRRAWHAGVSSWAGRPT